LFAAILLVVLVVMVFLQTWRASIIRWCGPISLIGTFAVCSRWFFAEHAVALRSLLGSESSVDRRDCVWKTSSAISTRRDANRSDAEGDGRSVGANYPDLAQSLRRIRATAFVTV